MKLKVCLHVHGKTSMKVQFIDTLADDPDVLIELNPYALVWEEDVFGDLAV